MDMGPDAANSPSAFLRMMVVSDMKESPEGTGPPGAVYCHSTQTLTIIIMDFFFMYNFSCFGFHDSSFIKTQTRQGET